MNQNSLISVIIPTYNEGPTLGVAIQSIIDQTYKNLEIIVVDDGSTDNTKEIVQEFTRKDSRVRYLECPYDDPYRVDIRGTNIGVGWVSRNFAMDQSRGEWITFQDADDASLINRIEVQYMLAVKYDAMCITTSWLPFDEGLLGKKLDVERITQGVLETAMTGPQEIYDFMKSSKGFLMSGWFPHNYVPFVFKKRLPTRPLFLSRLDPYPGTDGVPFFRRETIKTIRFRPRDKRVWPSLSGRGVGRDHVLQLAETYNKNYSFKLPLYLWRTKTPDKNIIARYKDYLL
ncbi:MAG: hypothetical protein A2481_02045 [Candidatus Yonathbacteria bacterium RIFOXYC2_FULL_47_9]|nr:MAG: hypothetical protein A2481_02045 [Candidatus Yonathbacteria bacterium RIFOXYC2_FULL_47_9]HAT68019.1 hypothetical protein [Candidatus Yonathbacteria bacterium]